jgi:hypothetical protein
MAVDCRSHFAPRLGHEVSTYLMGRAEPGAKDGEAQVRNSSRCRSGGRCWAKSGALSARLAGADDDPVHLL